MRIPGIELYLKALLRQHHSVQKLEGKFRHDVKRMRKGAHALGLSITDEDRRLFDQLRDPDVLLEARYIRTGPKAWPTLEELDRTCKSLRTGWLGRGDSNLCVSEQDSDGRKRAAAIR